MSKDDQKEILRQKMLEKQSEAKIARRIVLVITIILLIAFSIVGVSSYRYVTAALQPVDPENKTEQDVEIPIGSSVTAIGQILEDNGIIKSGRIFKYYVKFKNESNFQAGDYKLNKAMTFTEIIETLKTGKLVQEELFKITIPEGKQLVQIAEIVAKKTDYDAEEIFEHLNDREFIEKLQEKFPDVLTDEIFASDIKYPLEGYLFPATYPFYEENPSIEEIVEVMLKKTQDVLKNYVGKMDELEYTPHTMLTMASLIEEEATEKADREKISSVFYNRLNIDMPLQTDPTVLYALGEHKERTLYEHLEVDSPYNTYIHRGLPPGPIANSGTISIEAALNPVETDYLYFLATSSGEVIFTKTLDEHNREKAKHITGANN